MFSAPRLIRFNCCLTLYAIRLQLLQALQVKKKIGTHRSSLWLWPPPSAWCRNSNRFFRSSSCFFFTSSLSSCLFRRASAALCSFVRNTGYNEKTQTARLKTRHRSAADAQTLTLLRANSSACFRANSSSSDNGSFFSGFETGGAGLDGSFLFFSILSKKIDK